MTVMESLSSYGRRSDPSYSASVYQSLRPVTRSMTRVPTSILASSSESKGGSASKSTRKSSSDASFSTHSAALRPTVTRARTPHKVTTSAWKALTQSVALSEGQKCASLTTMNPNAKLSRVDSTRAAKDPTNPSTSSKVNSIALSGKKNRDEETTSQSDQSDAAAMPSPTKKLQTRKFPSDTCSKRVPSIRMHGGKAHAQLPTGKSQIETGKSSASVPAKMVSANVNGMSLSAGAAVQLDTAKNSGVITEPVYNEASQIQPFSAKVVNLPRPKLETDDQKMPSNVPMMMNQVSGLCGVTAPTPPPKLQIGNVNDTSDVLSNPAHARALLIKQQQKALIIKQQQLLLQRIKSGSSQQQEQELYIKGTALAWSDEAPPVEPLGTRCQLCKLDVAFRPQGDAGRDASAPPVVAVLACHHAFHNSCIESICSVAEPSQCIACAEAGPAP